MTIKGWAVFLPLGMAALALSSACGDDDNGPAPEVKPYIQTLPPPVHISHRGGADVAPENTLYAFDVAITQYRTDVLEIDLHPTSDGEIVILHDETVDRTTDATGLVREMTLAEVKTLDAAYKFDPDGDGTYPLRGQSITIPTLAEAFEAHPQMHFNLEIKEWDTVQIESTVVELVQAYGMEELVCWGSSNDGSAERLKALLPEVCIYYPILAASCFGLAVINGDDPMEGCDRYDALNIPESAATLDLIAAAHENAIPLYVWTVDDRTIMEMLFADGVDGIMTDRPDILRDVIDNL
jgi:glycerophosphoryl diester phosphodiesterase